MKFIIARDALLKPLQLVAGIAERRQTIPILAHVLLDVRGSRLTMVATDIETELQEVIDITTPVQEEGAITVAAKKLLDICRTLPENSELTINGDEHRVLITSGGSRFVLLALPAKQFPRFQAEGEVVEIVIAQQLLRTLLSKTAFAIPQQDIRQYLNGLLLEIKDGTIQVIATDGHRLALGHATTTVIDNSFAQILLPRKGVVELLRVLEDAAGDVGILLSNNSICIKGSNYVLFSKLANTKLPNYNKVIPKHGNNSFTIPRLDFKQALLRVGVLSNDLCKGVRCQVASGNLRLTTYNPEQEEAVEDCVIDYDGPSVEMSFNISYFLDILNAVSTEKIAIFFKDTGGSVIIEEVAGDDNYLYVIMPMH